MNRLAILPTSDHSVVVYKVQESSEDRTLKASFLVRLALLAGIKAALIL